jgi:hypothetical protein
MTFLIECSKLLFPSSEKIHLIVDYVCFNSIVMAMYMLCMA